MVYSYWNYILFHMFILIFWLKIIVIIIEDITSSKSMFN